MRVELSRLGAFDASYVRVEAPGVERAQSLAPGPAASTRVSAPNVLCLELGVGQGV